MMIRHSTWPACRKGTASPFGGCIFPPLLIPPKEGGFVAWRADSDPAVVKVEAQPPTSDDALAFDIRKIPLAAVVFRDPSGVEHLLIGDDLSQIRLDVTAG